MTRSMKVHGNTMSTAFMRVIACLYEKDIEFEFVNVDLRSGEQKTEAYLNLNPFGQVPAFEDGDLKLFESRAITKYIAQEYAEKGTQLVSTDSKNNAILLVWMEVESQQYEPAATKLVWEQMIKPMLGKSTNKSLVDENEAKLAKVLDVYEGRLSHFKYLACDSYTLADLHHLPTIHYLLQTQTKKLFDSRPHVSAWVSDITTRFAWQKVVAMQNK